MDQSKLKDEVELASHQEALDAGGLNAEERQFIDTFSDKAGRAAVRKVDWRLIPLLTFLYLMSYIDRTNIEIPSNWILSRFKKPSLYLGCLVVSWSLVMTFSGFVQSYGGLLAVRFLLGVTEAGFYPGALYLIGRWYTHRELQMRIAVFYSASAAAGAFSGLLAYVIGKLDGAHGFRGWRWIFIIEGAISALGGVLCLLFLPDDPRSSKRWLSQDEIRYLELRKSVPLSGRTETAEGEQRGFPWKTLRAVLLDWQMYLMLVVYWSNAMPTYGLKFTMPQVIKNMGFTSANAQLLKIPPYFMGAVSAICSSWVADRYTWRMPFIATGQVLLIVSFAILFGYGAQIETRVAECYFALVLACIGFYPILPGTNAWVLTNLEGQSKRALGIVFLASLGNLGGIPGSFFFKASEAPRYPTAYGASFSVAAAGFVACLALEFTYKRINAKRDRKTEEEYRRMYSDAQLDEMGDRSPLFRYTL